jgi:hypothetical protein
MDLEINDELWLAPEMLYWPSVKMMKELITIGS